MAKTVNVTRTFTLVRDDGTTQEFTAGRQKIEDEDLKHWFVKGNIEQDDIDPSDPLGTAPPTLADPAAVAEQERGESSNAQPESKTETKPEVKPAQPEAKK